MWHENLLYNENELNIVNYKLSSTGVSFRISSISTDSVLSSFNNQRKLFSQTDSILLQPAYDYPIGPWSSPISEKVVVSFCEALSSYAENPIGGYHFGEDGKAELVIYKDGSINMTFYDDADKSSIFTTIAKSDTSFIIQSCYREIWLKENILSDAHSPPFTDFYEEETKWFVHTINSKLPCGKFIIEISPTLSNLRYEMNVNYEKNQVTPQVASVCIEIPILIYELYGGILMHCPYNELKCEKAKRKLEELEKRRSVIGNEIKNILKTNGATINQRTKAVEFMSGSANPLSDGFLRSNPFAPENNIPIDEYHFPDAIFRNYISENFDFDSDDKLSEAELSECWMYIRDKGITSLKGIEYFTNLKELVCDNNKLTFLDVSKNSMLKILRCRANQLKTLDLTKNPALEILNCEQNCLATLNVSRNPLLKKLLCDDNHLTSLDVYKNPSLEILSCGNNRLTSLDISKIPSLETLNCDRNYLTALDVSQNLTLEVLWCNNNQLTSLDASRISALKILSCYDNQLISLDISKNPELEILYCERNRLTVLDVSQNPRMKILEYDFDDTELTPL